MHCTLTAIVVIASSQPLAAQSSVEAIMNGIMAGYDHTMRPSDPLLANSSSCSIDGSPDHVRLNFGIESLHSVDQQKLSYKLDGYFRASWRDPRLAFPSSVCRESIVLESPSVGGKRIWTPGLYIMNARAVQLGGVDGEAVFVERDGTVFWSRRTRVELQCADFKFGQFPFDVQMCPISIGAYRDKATQIRLSWRDASAPGGAIEMRPLASGFWTISFQEAHEAELAYSSGVYGIAEACLRFERSPGSFEQKIALAILLVIASYTGFFIAASAAPARVALGFISFLIVQSNLDSVLRDMPPMRSARDGGEHVWLVDFLYGTTIFNFFTVLEYGLVHHGINVSGRDLPSGSAGGQAKAASRVLDSMGRGFWSRCAKLDDTMKWLFPLAYGIFLVVMFSVISMYSHKDGCTYH